jgi:formylglycine-generating enzyme required for sulfatase activity
VWFCGAVAGLCSASLGQSPAQPPPNYDFQWATIGNPGNRGATQVEAPYFYPPLNTPAIVAGGVDYEFRMSRNEVTVGQWLQFLNAYWPYNQGSPGALQLTGQWIYPTNSTPGQNPGYTIVQGAANRPVEVSWRMAARYTNWLCNGQGTTAAAFTGGAYDTSTFTANPDHSLNDQRTHSPGATWIPTLDKWTKAMHYDPNKNGPGQEGYWLYPIGRDTPPISGWPEDGGETSAGLDFSSGRWLDVESYPNIQSTYGLWDGSGSAAEWTEYASPDGVIRCTRGSAQFLDSPEYFDRLDVLTNHLTDISLQGIRVASVVPASPTLLVAALALAPLRRVRRAAVARPCGAGCARR